MNAGLIAFYKTALRNTEMWSYAVWPTKQNNAWNGFQTKRESVMAADANELDKTQPSLIQNNAEENTENAQNKQSSSFHFNAYDFCASLNHFL